MPADAPSPRQIEAAMSEAMQLLAELPDDDERLRHDSLEGETGFFAVLDGLAEQAMADARLVELARERIKRLEERSDRYRDIIQRMMEIAALHKAERPLYTASLSYRAKTMVTDPDQLSDAVMRRAPDMVLIGKLLRDGQAVDGATLSNPQPVLTLRSA
jgi:hypothetical protein